MLVILAMYMTLIVIISYSLFSQVFHKNVKDILGSSNLRRFLYTCIKNISVHRTNDLFDTPLLLFSKYFCVNIFVLLL